MSHEMVRELTAAYAIGALDLQSRVAVEQHLGRCARCAAEARSLGDVAAVLGLDVTPAEPSSFVRVRLMYRLEAAE